MVVIDDEEQFMIACLQDLFYYGTPFFAVVPAF